MASIFSTNTTPGMWWSAVDFVMERTDRESREGARRERDRIARVLDGTPFMIVGFVA